MICLDQAGYMAANEAAPVLARAKTGPLDTTGDSNPISPEFGLGAIVL